MEQQKIQVPVLQKSVTTELSEEFTIPDYQPEIKRILRAEALVTPADRYVGPGNAEFSGKVKYTVYYLGEDGELYGSSFVGDYRVSEPVELPGGLSLSEGVLCDVDVFSESVACRLLSPRKFLVKTRLCSQIRLYATRLFDEEIPEGIDAERLEKECFAAEEFLGRGEPFHVFDEFASDGGETLRVIAAEGQVLVGDVRCGSGNLSCRGEIALKLLTATEDAPLPKIVFRKQPFTAELPADGVEVNCSAAACGRVTDLSVTVEDGRVFTDAEVELEARALRPSPVRYTKDAFAVGAEATPSHESCRIPTMIKCGVGNFTFSTSIPAREAGLPDAGTPIDFSIKPVVDSAVTEDGRFLLVGRCHCHAVLNDGDEWTSAAFDLPFRYDGGDCEKANVTDLLATANASSCRLRRDGDALNVDAEIALSFAAKGEETITRVASLEVGDAVERPDAALRICYPTPHDTLWSVAKRYHRPVQALADANNLPATADATLEVRFLVI